MWKPENFENDYSPKRLDDIVFSNEQDKLLIKQLVTGLRPFPIAGGKCGILLYGIPGTGKTALARLLGVRNRCHCIPFNAAPAAGWLPLAKRIITDAGISGISDQQLLSVIETGKGSARDITDAVISVVLNVTAQAGARECTSESQYVEGLL